MKDGCKTVGGRLGLNRRDLGRRDDGSSDGLTTLSLLQPTRTVFHASPLFSTFTLIFPSCPRGFPVVEQTTPK